MSRGSKRSESSTSISSRRRQLLAALGTGVTAGVAGCGGDGGDGTDEPTATDTESDGNGGTTGTPTSTGSGDLPQTSRTYRTFHAQDLTEINWSVYGHREQWPRFVSKFTFAYKASIDQQSGELIPMVVQDWSSDDSTIEFTFRSSGWSDDGSEIKAKDWGIPLRMSRWTGPDPSEFNEDNPPQDWWQAITDVEWDDKTLTVRSEPGWFANFWMAPAIQQMLTAHGGMNEGGNFPVKVSKYYEHVYEEANGYDEWQARSEFITNYNENELGSQIDGWSQNQAGEYVPDNPTQQPCSGAFALDEITETEIVLTKNPHFWNADAINWEEVRLDTMLEVRQRNQALVNNRLDGMNGQVYTPQANILDQLSDDWGTYRHNLSGTSGVVLNSTTVPWLGDPRVRQAIYLVLDKEELATQGHRYANTAPPNPPGLNGAELNPYIPEDVRSGFDLYERDTERAASLLEAAGFTMESGSWVTPGGDPAELELLANAEDVQVPALVQSYLNQFGITVNMVTNEGTVVSDRLGSGDWQMAMNGWWVDHRGMWFRAIQQSDRRHRFGMTSDQTIDEWVNNYSDQGVENVEYDWTYNLEGWEIEMMKDFTLPVPPVGERPINTDPSNMRQVPVFYYSFDQTWLRDVDEQTRQNWATQMAWAFNWYLPYLPFAISSQIAVQNHARWQAPTANRPWMQHAPLNKLIEQAEIHAKPE